MIGAMPPVKGVIDLDRRSRGDKCVRLPRAEAAGTERSITPSRSRELAPAPMGQSISSRPCEHTLVAGAPRWVRDSLCNL